MNFKPKVRGPKLCLSFLQEISSLEYLFVKIMVKELENRLGIS